MGKWEDRLAAKQAKLESLHDSGHRSWFYTHFRPWRWVIDKALAHGSKDA